MKVIAQWEHEDSKAYFLAKNLKWCPSIEQAEISAIVSRFQCEELKQSDCLRFVDYEFGAAYNSRQVETVEAEIKILLSLDLTSEEREDCLKLQKLLGLIEGYDRDLMYFRIFPRPNENFW
jgi:3'-phosphoadenosine 5'-phosphosulfate sulfotransferase (PAPS reductase)/FAD synthetase